MLYDQTNGRRIDPGYSLIGRMKGLAERRRVEKAVRAFQASGCGDRKQISPVNVLTSAK